MLKSNMEPTKIKYTLTSFIVDYYLFVFWNANGRDGGMKSKHTLYYREHSLEAGGVSKVLVFLVKFSCYFHH